MKRIKNFYKRIFAGLALFSLELLVVNIIFIVSIVLFITVWYSLTYGEGTVFDEVVFQWIDSFRSPGLTRFMEFVTFLSNREFITATSVILVLYFVFIKKHTWYSLKVPVVAIGCITLNLILKYIADRPRPVLPLIDATGFSFPSGHAMMSFSFYGLIIYLVWHNFKNQYVKISVCILLFILIHLIAFSRVYLRVHFTTDVIAGLALGAAWLVISVASLRYIEKITQKEIDPIIDKL